MLCGGHRVGDVGWKVAPTLLEGVAPDAPLSCEELFGPVAALYRVADLADAIALVNDSPYGLTAAIHTASVHRALRFAEEAAAGVVVVNAGTHGSEPHMGFGGVGQLGHRLEGGRRRGARRLLRHDVRQPRRRPVADVSVAVLGPGGVGGVIAVRTGALCVATPRSAERIRRMGLRLEHRGTVSVARPVVVERLERRVGLLVIAVKAGDLAAALERITPTALDGGSVVLPLQNGLEHLDRIRAALPGAAVVAGSIGLFQALRRR